jgi:hypothetical protein
MNNENNSIQLLNSEEGLRVGEAETGKIDWYSTGFPDIVDIQLFANADYRQRILYYTNWRSTSETINDGQMYNRNYNPGELVYSIGAGKFDQFACITFVFDIPQT